MQKFEGDSTAVIGEVNCEGTGARMCKRLDIPHYPYLAWGDPLGFGLALEKCGDSMGKDVASLEAFAKEKLKPICSPSNLDNCDDETKTQLEKFMSMKDTDLTSAFQRAEKEVKSATKDIDDKIEKIKASHAKLAAQKEKASANPAKAKAAEANFEKSSKILGERRKKMIKEADEKKDQAKKSTNIMLIKAAKAARAIPPKIHKKAEEAPKKEL